jgi:hypothetical protein
MIEKTITEKNSRTGIIQDRGRAQNGPNISSREKNGNLGMGEL